MNKTPLLLAVLTLSAAAASTLPDASAQTRARGRAVAYHGPDGAGAGRMFAAHSDRGSVARGGRVHGDGHGNVDGHRRVYAQGARGGTAQRHESFHRNADGSAGRQYNASIDGARGGAMDSSGSLARDADGHVSGRRATSVTGRNGATYTGATSVANGTLTHTHTCANAAGEPVACRRN